MAQDAKQQTGAQTDGAQHQPQSGTPMPQQQQAQTTTPPRQIIDLASI